MPISTVEKIVNLKLGDTMLLIIHMPVRSFYDGFHFCLESDSSYNDYLRLTAAGVPVAKDPRPAGARELKEKD